MIYHDAPVPHWVYVHFDKDDTALYVGMTADLEQRLANHRSRSMWFKDIDRVHTYGPLSTWRIAHEIECLAIRAWAPKYNQNHNHRANPPRSEAEVQASINAWFERTAHLKDEVDEVMRNRRAS